MALPGLVRADFGVNRQLSSRQSDWHRNQLEPGRAKGDIPDLRSRISLLLKMALPGLVRADFGVNRQLSSRQSDWHRNQLEPGRAKGDIPDLRSRISGISLLWKMALPGLVRAEFGVNRQLSSRQDDWYQIQPDMQI
ncbi:hypothetical protein DdX_11675 [Ditylenchus destructor]|uniref:Uncharacterized protein n=1 Tax=Ditylenchus destructor TaxID=166010 RepID=A0AAD4MXX3_9BILA|nr:hypothetical protein DdX_11675 [Ditylenchus destructor]